ncbi:MAG: PilW family protein [Nitrospirales bacterium]
MSQVIKKTSAGYTLVEVVVALGLSLFTLSLLYAIYVTELKAQQIREDVLDAQQRARVVVDLLSRELLMAGYDPAGLNHDADPTNDFPGVAVASTGLQIKADINGNGILSDPNETILFSHDPSTNTLRRNTGGGNQPFAEDIEVFQVSLLDREGNQTGVPTEVRAVQLIVTARTTKPDLKYAQNGGYRTVAFQERVVPRNLVP